MDSNTSGFLLNSSNLQSAHFEAKQDDDADSIDLGLSLRTLQPEDYHPSGTSRLLSLEGYDDWPQANLNLNGLNSMHRRNISEGCYEESEGVQSKENWGYVKVNMDGVIVGRKICIPDHGDYSGLAYHLEDMFGTQVVSGLRLFQDGSEFTLLYKDREENWRAVGDVPWKVFVQCVKRLRIARNNADPVPGSSKFT